METKQCSACGEFKALDAFYRHPRTKDRLNGTCKSCMNRRTRQRRAAIGAALQPRVARHSKRCYACGVEKPASAFQRNRTKSDWLRDDCRECANERRKRYVRDNPHRIKEQDLRRKFGISLSKYQEMLDRQGGVCAICGKAETHANQYRVLALAVDHSHITGDVRGLLCHACNTAIGLLGENPVLFAAAVVYLSQHQVVVHAKPTQELRPVA